MGGHIQYAPGFRPGLWSGGPTGRSGYVHSPRWGVEVLGPAALLRCWGVYLAKRLNISTGRSPNN